MQWALTLKNVVLFYSFSDVWCVRLHLVNGPEVCWIFRGNECPASVPAACHTHDTQGCGETKSRGCARGLNSCWEVHHKCIKGYRAVDWWQGPTGAGHVTSCLWFDSILNVGQHKEQSYSLLSIEYWIHSPLN